MTDGQTDGRTDGRIKGVPTLLPSGGENKLIDRSVNQRLKRAPETTGAEILEQAVASGGTSAGAACVWLSGCGSVGGHWSLLVLVLYWSAGFWCTGASFPTVPVLVLQVHG